MRRVILAAIVAGVSAFSIGCTKQLGEFTVISTKDMQVEGKRGARVEGEDSQSIIVFWPNDLPPTLEDAVTNTLAEHGGDGLVAATVKHSSWYIPLIYGSSTITVEGTIVDTKVPEDDPKKKGR